MHFNIQWGPGTSPILNKLIITLVNHMKYLVPIPHPLVHRSEWTLAA